MSEFRPFSSGLLRVSVVVSASSQPEVSEAVRSVLAQDYENLECLVVTSSPAETGKLPTDLSDRIAVFEASADEDTVRALNRAFGACKGDILTWLDGDELLAPWACRVIAHLLGAFPNVDWVTSGAEYEWSPSRMMIARGVADGYTRRGFFAGRNLKPSPYFHHAIPRAGTFWRRELWNRSGSQVCADLAHAGDFELWSRFFEHSELAMCLLPLGGKLASGGQDDAEYWRAAAKWLDEHRATSAPPRWVALRRFLIRRIPALARRWGSPARILTIAAPTDECFARSTYIF